MRKKVASLKFYELAENLYLNLSNISNNEEKSGIIMVMCQNYFYAGETGIKYLLNFSNRPINRENILFELKTYLGSNMSEIELEKIEKLYLFLLPKNVGGTGFRNVGAYQGKYSPSDIYKSHRDFAKYIINIIKNENNSKNN